MQRINNRQSSNNDSPAVYAHIWVDEKLPEWSWNLMPIFEGPPSLCSLCQSCTAKTEFQSITRFTLLCINFVYLYLHYTVLIFIYVTFRWILKQFGLKNLGLFGRPLRKQLSFVHTYLGD